VGFNKIDNIGFGENKFNVFDGCYEFKCNRVITIFLKSRFQETLAGVPHGGFQILSLIQF
jgi:hypothetical protein